MHTVKVFNNSGNAVPTNVKIDGTPIGCRSVDYHVDRESISVFVFEIPALTDIEVNHAAIQFRFATKTAMDAVKILRHELLHDEVLRSGFKCSIASALKEFHGDECKYGLLSDIFDPDELAEAVMCRMIGCDEPYRE